MKKQRQLNRSRYRWLAMLVAILSLAGCTIPFPPPGTPGAAPGGTTPGDMTPSSTPNSESAPLAGTSWQLTALGTTGAETPVVVDSTVTLQFDADGQAGGNTGCNSFGGNYTVNGDSLTFSKIISTLVACADANVMSQEQQYVDALNGAERYAVDGDELTIWYDNGNSMLTFTAGTAVTPAPTDAALTATPAPPATPLPTVTMDPTTVATTAPGAYPPSPATRITFGPGETSANVDGDLAAGARDYYVLAAQAGQEMSVEIMSPNNDVLLAVVGEDGTPYKRYENGGAFWTFTLPATQDYYLEAVSVGAATTYTVHVAIAPLDGANTGDFPPSDATRINFAPGTTSATINGNIAARGRDAYVLSAQAGQEMSVEITSPHNDVLLSVIGADGTPYKRYQNGPPSWTSTLPATQDYYIEAVSVGPATDYALSVSISALGGSVPSTPNPVEPPEQVQFAAGAVSAQRSSLLPSGPGIKQYVLTANAGQSMTVDATSDGAPLSMTIEEPGGNRQIPEMQRTANGYTIGRQFSTPAAGEYVVTLQKGDHTPSTNVNITFTIE